MARKGVLIGLLVAVLASTAWGFQPYFSNAAGQKLGTVWEGQQVYVVVKDPEKGACGIDQFQADLVIFDAKTGAFVVEDGAWFRELGGIGSGLYFWVDARSSNVKVTVQVGSRDCFVDPTITAGCWGNTHVLGTIAPGRVWFDGTWEYVDEALLVDFNPVTFDATLPFARLTSREDFGLFQFTSMAYEWGQEETIDGRFENNDTLILIVRDLVDDRNIDQDQIKIRDTVGKLAVVPSQLDYGCGPSCTNIVVTIEDMDENLNCNAVEYVPFFVILNPGSWNADVNGFCSLMMRGGYVDDARGGLFEEPIRWYNIYEPARFIDYSDAPWWNYVRDRLPVVFFAAETSVDSGVFTFDFGNLNDFQAALGLDPNDRLPPGTTIAFYYIDPNDFDDMDLATVVVGNRPHSQTFITDATGNVVNEVRIGAGWGGMYIRVYDADANVQACCQDKVVVHICDPHNEDDSEYYVIDEISNDSGIFFSQSGIPLLPVWDAVAGYQLVFDDWRIQSFNEDTIFVRYNSVDYVPGDLNLLGDGDPNVSFPPEIDYTAARNQYWDVSFAKVKVYDYQVFDGDTHHMRFLNGQYQPVTTIPLSGSLYLEVTDLDQNEHPGMRELIFGGWNKDANAADDRDDNVLFAEDTAPLWGHTLDNRAVLFNAFLQPESISGIPDSVKVFMFNAQRGTWERMDLRETAVGSGIFRSTVCVLVADARFPGQGNLGSAPGDTIMAFYQDPSNHSDISMISIKVAEGGAGGVTPPVVALGVAFDRATYNPGDMVTITVTDEQYAGAMTITGTNPLELKKADGTILNAWTSIPAVAGQPGKFRVTYQLPTDVTGTITVFYVDPMITTRSASAQATVAAPVMTGVSDVKPVPEVFSTSTVFTVFPQPAGAVAARFAIAVYDLTGRKVWEDSRTNTNTVTWNGGTLRNGAYIYAATVEWAGGQKVVQGFVYIKR